MPAERTIACNRTLHIDEDVSLLALDRLARVEAVRIDDGRGASALREDAGVLAPFEEARHSCEFGLLVSQPPQSHQLRATGERLVEDAIVPLEKLARS